MENRGNRKRGQRGYTLLEYCAGAAVIATILWAALNTMGNSVGGMLGSIGEWATRRGTAIDAQ